MIITIAGCGALGTVLAARLIAGGAQVQLFQRPGEQLDALAAGGITIEASGAGSAGTWQPMAVAHDARALAPADLVLVLVKSGQTAHLTGLPDLLTSSGLVLSLQNGLGNAEALAGIVGAERVLAGCCTYGAYRIAPGVTGWGGEGELAFGPWTPEAMAHGRQAADVLADAGLAVRYLDDPRPALWRKLLLNLMINPVTALTGLRNGDIRHHPEAMDLVTRLMGEGLAAAGLAGVDMDRVEIENALAATLEGTASNKSSMLQDVEAGRATEADAILKPILDLAPDQSAFACVRTLYALLTSRGR